MYSVVKESRNCGHQHVTMVEAEQCLKQVKAAWGGWPIAIRNDETGDVHTVEGTHKEFVAWVEKQKKLGYLGKKVEVMSEAEERNEESESEYE